MCIYDHYDISFIYWFGQKVYLGFPITSYRKKLDKLYDQPFKYKVLFQNHKRNNVQECF